MTDININREEYKLAGVVAEFEDLFGKQAPETRDKASQLAGMVDQFGMPISESVTHVPNSKDAVINPKSYSDNGFLTSLANKTLVQATPWKKLLNIFAIAGSVCTIILVLGLQKPLLLIGLPLIAIANFLYVYKFASKDIYLGVRDANGKFVGKLVNPLTHYQKHLLHVTGQLIFEASARDVPENPLVVEDSERSFKYMESLRYSTAKTYKADGPDADRTKYLQDDLAKTLNIQQDDLFCDTVINEIKTRLSESSAGLEKIDTWMKGFVEKFTSPSRSPSKLPNDDSKMVFNHNLITPEEFSELFTQINKVRYIRQQIIDYFSLTEAIMAEYYRKYKLFDQDNELVLDGRRMLLALDNTLEHIESKIFVPTQKILQYYDSEKASRGDALESVLFLLHSKLLEIIHLDNCVTYFRDMPHKD